MSKTHFPRVGGNQWVDSFYRPPVPTTGNVFWVHSGTGSNSPADGGRSPEAPFATLAAAVSAATASNGDVVYLMPGHNENIGNEQITISKAGLKIVGLGEGSARARFDYDHANASIDITASGVTLQGIDLLPSVTVVAIGIDVNTLVTDTTLRDIRCLSGEDGAGVDEFVITVDIKVGCTRTLIEGCDFDQHASSTGQTHHVKLSGASDQVTVRGCYMKIAGAAAVACIGGITTLSTRVLIEKCLLVADDEPGIELLTGTTGVIRDVDIFSDLATIAAATVADGMAHFRVEYVEVGNESNARVKTASADD